MAKKSLFKIRLTADRLAVLAKVYDGMWANYGPATPHELILHGHITEMRDRLNSQVEKEQLQNTISFTPLEALAFVQTWQKHDMPIGHFPAIIVNQIVAELDQTTIAYRIGSKKFV